MYIKEWTNTKDRKNSNKEFRKEWEATHQPTKKHKGHTPTNQETFSIS